MYPLHDNDLDRLSREAAEHFEVEPGASGWAHLEKRLDEELPQKKKRRRFLFWLFFLTATTGGALTAILTHKPASPLGNNAVVAVTPAQKPAVSQQQETAKAAINEAVQPGAATGSNTPATTTPAQSPANANTVTGNNPNAAGSNEHTVNPVVTASAASKPNTTGANQAADATILNTSPNKKAAQPIAKANNSKKLKPVSPTGTDNSPLSLNYATIAPTNKGVNGLHTTKTKGNKTGKKKGANQGQQQQTISPAPDNTAVADHGITANDQQPATDPVAVNDKSSTPQPTTTSTDSAKSNAPVPPAADSAKTLAKENNKKPDAKKDKNEKGFELGLMAGPDASTVKFGPLYKPGYNFGLYIGYRFSNRWSVNTGLIYTKKWYKANGKDFHYKTQWPLEKAEGNCSMWEIPVNVRYDVSYNAKRRWFASTGLSTYLMNKENYDLYYSWPTPYPWNIDSNSTYLFSIWNLSVGMERSLGKHVSIQAEPYLKIPLQGLGTGSMRMDSYGINFTLKYKFGSRTK